MSNWDRFIEKPIVYILKALLILTLSITRTLDLRIGLLPRSLSICPTRRLRIPASGPTKRTISVHVFEPPNINEYKRPLPVHVNFHGSAFVLPVHGSDAEICTYLATKLGCIVLDADYAKAPKHPFPAAIDDAMAVLSYVSSRPNIYDLDRVSIGGFSAGANVAILAAIRATKSSFPLHIKSIIAWYPPTNLTRAGTEAKSRSSLLNWLHHTLRSCYLPPGIDRGNPLVSPLFAKSSLFPPTTLIVGEEDKLFVDSVELAKKLNSEGVDCVLHTVPEANHAWERFVKKGTTLWAARERALDLTITRLREAYSS